jgi:Flp pilus assembly protein TadD
VALSNHPDLLLEQAAMAGRRGREWAWREFLVQRARRVRPESAPVLIEMASMIRDVGRPADALTYLRRAESVAPEDPQVLAQLGMALIEAGRSAEAEDFLRRAIRAPNAPAEYALGSLLEAGGDWTEARAHLERALEIDPSHGRAMVALALGFARQGDVAAARASIDHAAALTSVSAADYAAMGLSLLNAGQTAAAVDVLRKSLSMHYASADAHNNLGVAYSRQGHLKDAEWQFREALRFSPGDMNIIRNLNRVRAAQR